VTDPPVNQPAANPPGRRTSDVIGALLLLAGAVLVVWAAFRADTTLGLAVLGAALVAGGLLLGR
jgi:drug/metabolite transporter (DMT)-like permease